MNANKRSLTSLVFTGLLLILPSLAQAQSTAPPLYGVREMQIQHGRIGNQKASANCGTSSGEIAVMVLKAFQTEGLPAFSVLNAKPPAPQISRIEIYPDVVTLQPHERDCISWVALSAQSNELLQINPVKIPRNLTTTYWTGGMMVGSAPSSHPTAINEAFMKLAAQFARQYALDQPPDLTPPDQKK